MASKVTVIFSYFFFVAVTKNFSLFSPFFLRFFPLFKRPIALIVFTPSSCYYQKGISLAKKK